MAASLPELDKFDRNALSDQSGRTLKELRRLLKPRWARVWADIAGGYLVLGAIFAALLYADRAVPAFWPLTVVLGASGIGYAVAYLQLFFHEAAHYNLAKDRAFNDALANLFIGLMLGQHIKAYRLVHFDHHRHLGTPADTEHSYFDALNARFLIESGTGIKVLRVLADRGKLAQSKAEEGTVRDQPNTRWLLLSGLLLNLAIIGLALRSHSWSLALAWPLGVLVVHPAINAFRQLLEHRSFDAKSNVDYGKEPHGAVTRLFGSGPIASTLGGAGFNRHLLHHWEPQLSYTRFVELEAFLLETAAADVVRSNTTTYARAFFRLMRAP